MLWRPIRLLPDGHRLFGLADRDAIAIADNSGDTPDQTDGGVLWLDRQRPLRAERICLIPLLTAEGVMTTTPTDVQTLLKLSAEYSWEIVGAHGQLYATTTYPQSQGA